MILSSEREAQVTLSLAQLYLSVWFNSALTPARMAGTTVPVVITVFSDRTFEFITKSPPAAVLLKQAAQIAKGSGNPKVEKVGSVTTEQLKEIARVKFEDLNAPNIDQAALIIAGTARNMGIEVVD